MLVKELALGTMHSMLLMSDGSCYVMGNSLSGILGIPNCFDKLIEPTKIENIKFFVTKTTDIREGTIFQQYTSEATIKPNSTTIPTFSKMISCSLFNTAIVLQSGDLYMAGEDKLIVTSKSNSDDKLEGDTEELQNFGKLSRDNQTWNNKLTKIICPEDLHLD